ncbi:MAG: HD-GYP domain-containing protein [Angelakisella sp.]|nr:HD-GYP domain-containing protein [Angelakisella sp.]
MTKKATIYVYGVILIGMYISIKCTISYVAYILHNPHWETIQYSAIMFLLCVLCRSLPIYISEDRALDVSFVSVLAVLLMSGPESAVALILLSTPFVVECGQNKGDPVRHIFNISPIKTFFNISNLTISVYLPGLVFLRMGAVPGQYEYPFILVPTLTFVGLCLLLNAIILIRLFTLGGQGDFWPTLGRTVILVGPNMLAVAPLGLLIATLLQLPNGPYIALLFLTPLLLARYTFKLYLNSKQEFYRMVQTLVATIEAKDKYTEGHSKRVGAFAEQIATEMGFSSSRVSEVRVAALLHDVGKIGVKDEILNKPGKLTEEEWESVKEHPQTGVHILEQVELPGRAKEMILHHHERYDGKGYPMGVDASQISIGAFVLGVADAYDAMTSDRSYRKGMDKEVAIRILEEEKGRQFHPEVVEVFVKILKENREVVA